MTHIIAEPCIGVKDTACVDVCPVDCIYGKDCTYRHCAPTEQDETNTDAPHDVFGRNRHGTFRDDMGGVGSWHRECKTIYVGQVRARVRVRVRVWVRAWAA